MITSTLNNLDNDVWHMILDHLYVPGEKANGDRPVLGTVAEGPAQAVATPTPEPEPDKK